MLLKKKYNPNRNSKLSNFSILLLFKINESCNPVPRYQFYTLKFLKITFLIYYFYNIYSFDNNILIVYYAFGKEVQYYIDLSTNSLKL